MDDDYLTYQFDQLNRQAEITEAVNAYKQELIEFLDSEINRKEEAYACTYDMFDSGMRWADEKVMEFIQKS